MSYSVLTLIRRRFPWLLDTAVGTTPTMSGAFHHLFTTEHLFGHRIGLRSTLESPKLLLSPCDPDRKGANDLVDFTKFSHHVVVPNEAHSYGLAVGKDSPRDKGADASKPQTILVMT